MPIIDEKNIKRANDNSFFDKGKALEREAQGVCDGFRKNFEELEKKLGGFSEEQEKILAERETGFRQLVSEQYNELASFHASNVPWYVAGPAGYNGARYNKKHDSAMRKFSEKEEKRERFIENTKDMLMKATSPEKQIEYWRNGKNGYGETIRPDDPLSVEKMEAHIAYLKEAHQKSLKINEYVRKNGTAKGCELLSEKQADEIDDMIQRNPIFKNNVMFTANDTANIRNKERRLEQLKRSREESVSQDTDPEGSDLIRNGVRMKIDRSIARVQLLFDKKPDENVRAKLKANGFRWSPNNSAWQRQDTPNGIAVAKRMLEELAA